MPRYSRTPAEITAELNLLELDKKATADKLSGLNSIFNTQKRLSALQEQALNGRREENLLAEQYLSMSKNSAKFRADEIEKAKQDVINIKEKNRSKEKELLTQKKNNDLLKHYYEEQKKIFSLQAAWVKSLMDSDKIIRTTILNLGMSGKKAEMMRQSFEKSAVAVAQMGGSLKDIQAVQEGFANETGRARVMTAQMVKDIVSIGRGTGLGVEEATKLGAQFELMGIDVTKTTNLIQGIVDTSERMGVNTTKVFKGVNDNFKRLQTYSFQSGVKGMLKMSQYATKMNIDMNQALNAADIAKSLEGAIDLAAQLQVMGGEFAKADPFQLLFLSRNDPEEYTKKINDMTKGLVTMRKVIGADGKSTFEKFISPADRQRMAGVEKSLGMQNGELTQQALRMYDIQKMRQNMLGSSLSKGDREAVEGAAIFNSKSNSFQVMIGNTAKNITDLTSSEAKMFVQHQVLLDKRAKDSLTFQESLQAALESFRAAFLPMLRGFNWIMSGLKPIMQNFAHMLEGIPGKFLMVVGAITGALILLNGAITTASKMLYIATGKDFFARGARATGNAVGNAATSSINPNFLDKNGNPLNAGAQKARNIGIQNQGMAAQAAGKGKMMAGAGIGMAAVGIGAGIGVAAYGISQLAKAMKELDKTQIAALPGVILSLGGALALATIPLIGLAAAATAGGPGLWTLGVVALGVGAGIGVAAAGVGLMAKGLSELVVSAKGAGPSLLEIAGGIAAIGGAGFLAGTVGTIGLAATLGTIAAFATPIGKVGEAFKEIKLAMSGSKEDFIAIQNAVASISSMNTSKGSAFAQLAELLKTPLKVEFADKKIPFVSDITMLIDGQKFMERVFHAPGAANVSISNKNGTSAPPHLK